MGKSNQSTQEINSQAQNPLGTAPVGGLIAKFAIPAIISMLVSAMYNIVDQIFYWTGCRYAGKCGNECGVSGYDNCDGIGIASGNRRCVEL